MNTLTKKLIATLTSLLTVSAFVIGSFFATGTAYAAPASDDSTPPPFWDGSRLELACRQTGRVLEGQQDRLEYAKDVADKSQKWIDYLKSEGKDTASLESALSAYNTLIATAQSQHDGAQNTFNTQTGFDGHCQLTDREQAALTLRTVGDGLREAHRALTDAARTFRRAVQDWRKANRPTTLP
jgi:hypothetical protein